MTLIDPSTEQPHATLPMASPADVSQAVARARATLLAERDAPVDRAGILSRLITAIEARREDFARAIATEMGAPIDFSRSKQVDAGLDHMRVILAAMGASPPEICPDAGAPEHWLRYEPLGVAALITPWNWPLNQVALKVGAALAAGCTMVLKPSELSSLSALLFADCMQEAGASPGLFTVVLGDGAVGAALVAEPGVNVVSFTGSTEVGRKIAARAGADLKPVLLELGGKSANILFDDCHVTKAVRQGMAHCFRNSGQSCNGATRMLVQRGIYDSVVALAAEMADAVRFGAPMLPGAHLGPLVSEAQFAHVQACILEAMQEGARLVAGGPGRPRELARGFYPKPTVFADVKPGMALFHREVFGPVLSITLFDTEDEAVALANDTAYGLAAYVQTDDPLRAALIARRLDVGMVQIDGKSRAPGAPFGGRKQSGFGREAGLWGIRAFQDVKSVSGAPRD